MLSNLKIFGAALLSSFLLASANPSYAQTQRRDFSPYLQSVQSSPTERVTNGMKSLVPFVCMMVAAQFQGTPQYEKVYNACVKKQTAGIDNSLDDSRRKILHDYGVN